jgi:hypothetical protein
MATTRRRSAAAGAPQVGALLALIDEAFDRKAWHGTNLRGSLRGLDARQAAWRPAPGRHNVWELTVHAAYWKYSVRRRLTGEKRGSFAEKGSNFFARPAPGKSWEADVALLVREHALLREEIARLADRDLGQRVGGSRWTRAAMLRGIASHDLYHCGQIQALKRLMR